MIGSKRVAPANDVPTTGRHTSGHPRSSTSRQLVRLEGKIISSLCLLDFVCWFSMGFLVLYVFLFCRVFYFFNRVSRSVEIVGKQLKTFFDVVITWKLVESFFNGVAWNGSLFSCHIYSLNTAED